MISFDDVELFCLGTAALLDTVVLLMLAEGRNRQRSPLPLVLMILGVWLFHAGTFVAAFLRDSSGRVADGLMFFFMTAGCAGLLLLPSAMLHSLLRLRFTGFTEERDSRRGFAWLYLPVLLIGPAIVLVGENPRAPFLTLSSPLVSVYVLWLSTVNLYCASGFRSLAKSEESPSIARFFRFVAATLLSMTILQGSFFLLVRPFFPDVAPAASLVVLLSPTPLMIGLAWSVVRFNFLQLVLRRSLVYGTVLVVFFLFNRIILADVRDHLTERLGIDFAVVEIGLLFAIVLVVQPLRRRAAEALRYLMGESVQRQRDRMRRLSVELSALSERPLHEILQSFEDAVRGSLDVDLVRTRLFTPESHAVLDSRDDGRLRADETIELARELRTHDSQVCLARDAPSPRAQELMKKSGAALTVLVTTPRIEGFVLVGPRSRNRELSEEQLNMVLLLCEQLGVTVTSSLLQADRLAAERKALQNDKLSTLGLVASSIAHEVKNPLSSIKTIVTVMAEELGPDSAHTRDLELIRREIDRLSKNVSRLLAFVRPGLKATIRAPIASVLDDALGLLAHLAKQRGIRIDSDLATDLDSETEDEAALRDVFFNLIKNALDAVEKEGRVSVRCRKNLHHVVVEIEDDGHGIRPEIQDRMFEPFVSTKGDGTGLGLYLVGIRVRELGAEIDCASDPERGTTFTVRFPLRPQT